MEKIVSERRTGPKIIEARRLQRKIIVDGTAKYIDTQSVIITFEGKIIPSSIKIKYCEVRVDIYVSPVIMCFNCMRYGHSNTQCRSKQRCSKCAEEHDISACQEKEAVCIYCKGNHVTTDRNCPEYKRQRAIKEIMAAENTSYFEARNKVPKNYLSAESSFVGAHLDSRDFPSTLNKQLINEGIPVRQRMANIQSQKSALTQKPTYSQVSKLKRKKLSSPPPLINKIDTSPINPIINQVPSMGSDEVEVMPLTEIMRKTMEESGVSLEVAQYVLGKINASGNAQISNSENNISLEDMELEVLPGSSQHTP